MPVKPLHSYVKLSCQACNWHKTIRMRNDVLFCPPQCPSCGCKNLSAAPTKALDAVLSDPIGYLTSVLKGH